jgi:hypothetical protein
MAEFAEISINSGDREVVQTTLEPKFWVIRVVSAISAVSPLYPHEPTSSARSVRSEKGQKRVYSREILYCDAGSSCLHAAAAVNIGRRDNKR